MMSTPKTLLVSIAWLLSMHALAGMGTSTQESKSCLLCGMEIKANTKLAFETSRDGKPVHLCSFACASSFQEKYPQAQLFARDYGTGNRIDARSAYFLIRSKNILKEIEFGMPPVVLSFASEEAAKKAQTHLKDGELVKGYDALKNAFKK